MTDNCDLDKATCTKMIGDRDIPDFTSPYESLMTNHLKTYGYFSKSQRDLQNEIDTCKKFNYSVADLWGCKQNEDKQNIHPYRHKNSKMSLVEAANCVDESTLPLVSNLLSSFVMCFPRPV